MFVPAKLIPSKQSSKLTIKEPLSNITKKHDYNRNFDESTKTHWNTIHSRNASLPSLNSPPFQEFFAKNKENEMKKTFMDSPKETFTIPKNVYFNKILEVKSKNAGIKRLKETLDLNCYHTQKKKKSFF